MQNQTLEVLEFVAKNNYEEISSIFEQFSNCLKCYIAQFPEKVVNIFESFVEKVENEKNFKILINCLISFILNSSEKIRNKSLNNFKNCIDKKLKLDSSNISLLCKNQTFWKYLINQLLLPILTEILKKISSLNNIINNNSININSNNQTLDSTKYTSGDNSFDATGKNGVKNLIIEKSEYCNTLENILIQLSNLFIDFFIYNYKEISTFYEYLKRIIFAEDEKIQQRGLECVKYINENITMKNKYFLETYTIFLITLLNKSLEENLTSTSEKEILEAIKSKSNLNNIDIDLSLYFIHITILSLVDKLLSSYISFLSEDILEKLLDGLEASISISNNINSNISLRLTLTEYNKNISNIYSLSKNGEVINLFHQFQIAIKTFFFITQFLYNKENGINHRLQYYKKIMIMSIKLINYYSNKNKEFLNLLNKSDNDKVVKEKEAELNNFVEPLCEYIFPSIKKLEFYKNENYKDIISKLLFELILCYDMRIRENIKLILGLVFENLYKNDRIEDNE